MKLQEQHLILVEGGAHGFWYDTAGARRLYVNIYLDSHSACNRAQQLKGLCQAIETFRTKSAPARLEVIICGERDFVMDPAQRDASGGRQALPRRRCAACGVRCAACGVQCRAVVYGVMYAHSERPL